MKKYNDCPPPRPEIESKWSPKNCTTCYYFSHLPYNKGDIKMYCNFHKREFFGYTACYQFNANIFLSLMRKSIDSEGSSNPAPQTKNNGSVYANGKQPVLKTGVRKDVWVQVLPLPPIKVLKG